MLGSLLREDKGVSELDDGGKLSAAVYVSPSGTGGHFDRGVVVDKAHVHTPIRHLRSVVHTTLCALLPDMALSVDEWCFTALVRGGHTGMHTRIKLLPHSMVADKTIAQLQHGLQFIVVNRTALSLHPR